MKARPVKSTRESGQGRSLTDENLIFVQCEAPALVEPARQLACDLDLVFLDDVAESRSREASLFRYALVVTNACLELRSTKKGGPKGVYVDFGAGAVDYRRRYGSEGGQLIVKAIGGPDQKVFDATAGLCGDAFVLASHACSVTATEVNPIISVLVIDGLRRGLEDPKIKYICERIEFRHGDSLQFIKNKKDFNFDVIYLDPMFAEKKKTALPKKELQVLQDIVGDGGDERSSRELLIHARKACGRVVVKRHLRAPALADDVSVVFKGTSIRFDVYLK